MSSEIVASSPTAPRWRAVPAKSRRILGVLIEKAKTTPDAYPLTLNALTTGCNQKSNRDPHMELDSDDVEACLEDLREIGAVVEIAGSGRVSKFKHLLYEWLGVDKVELAVMGELLLRGAQTVGELRGRAARMEPIADLGALKPVLQSLIDKKLILSLSPEGRGQVVTHNLYQPEELDRVKSKVAAYAAAEEAAAPAARPAVSGLAGPTSVPPVPDKSKSADSRIDAELQWLRGEIEALRKELTKLQQDVGDLWKSLS